MNQTRYFRACLFCVRVLFYGLLCFVTKIDRESREIERGDINVLERREKKKETIEKQQGKKIKF